MKFVGIPMDEFVDIANVRNILLGVSGNVERVISMKEGVEKRSSLFKSTFITILVVVFVTVVGLTIAPNICDFFN